MSRTPAAASFVFLLALPSLSMAHADQPHPRAMIAFCETTTPFVLVDQPTAGGTWSHDGIPGRGGSTGPTVPVGCMPPA